MAAPILWAPGIFWFFLRENPMPIKFLLLGGGGVLGFSRRWVEVLILFLWAWGFFPNISNPCALFCILMVRDPVCFSHMNPEGIPVQYFCTCGQELLELLFCNHLSVSTQWLKIQNFPRTPQFIKWRFPLPSRRECQF